MYLRAICLLLAMFPLLSQAAPQTGPPTMSSVQSADSNILYRHEQEPGGERILRKPPEAAIPSPPAVPRMAQPAPASMPDEEPLWTLLRQERYRTLLKTIAETRQHFPHWQPPPRLLDLARIGERRQHLDALVKAENEAGLLAAYRAEPQTVGCGHLPAARLVVRALATENPAQAADLVKRLIDCPGDEDRLATLAYLREVLPEATFIARVDDVLAGNSAHAKQLLRLRYEVRIKGLLAADDRGDGTEVVSRLATLAEDITAYRDTNIALVGAWAALRTNERALADLWFRRALEWDPKRDEARVGAALCALGDANYGEVIELARKLPGSQPERTGLLRDAHIGKAQIAYGLGRHAEVLLLLDEAQEYGSLPRYARLMESWSHLKRDEPKIAAEKFSTLYSELPDQESAEGILNAMARLEQDDELDRLAKTEPLKSLVNRHRAEQAFADKRFLAVRRLDPTLYPEAGGIGIPRIALFSGFRHKSGTPGTSKLSIDLKQGLEASWGDAVSGNWRLNLDHLVLDSDLASDGNNTHVDGWQTSMAWQSDHHARWEAELGTTPGGGVVSPTLTGLLARNWSDKNRASRLEFHRQPVRESILSYTGLRDAAAGATWGRVMRNGLLFQHREALAQGWTGSLQAQIEELNGRNVKRNRRITWDASLGYVLPLPEFDYAVVSLAASGDKYQNNLSQFTPGHGGYFSPQRYWQIGPSFDFMTQENRTFMLRGRLALGRTGKREDETPFLPLTDNGQHYAGNSGTGVAREIEVGGVWQVNERIQAGGWLTTRHSQQYDDRAALFFIRFLFEPRRSVLSSDLPNNASLRLF